MPKPSTSGYNPLQMLTLSEMASNDQDDQVDQILEIVYEMQRPSWAKIFLVEDRAVKVNGDFNTRLSETPAGCILDAIKENMGPLVKMTMYSFTLERLIKAGAHNLVKPNLNGAGYCLFKFDDEPYIPKVYSSNIVAGDDAAMVNKKTLWKAKTKSKRTFDDFVSWGLVMSHILRHIWKWLSRVNIVTHQKSDHVNKWPLVIERLEIPELSSPPQVLVLPQTKFEQALLQAGILVEEMPDVLTAVAMMMHIKPCIEGIASSMVTMSVNQNNMDENTIMIELARSMSVLVQMPNYIMVGKNTTMFCGKTLTALDSQRVGSIREWFHCGLMIRPYPDLSDGVRKMCEKIDNVNTANGIFTMIEDMIAKFGDALYVYIKWVDLDEFTKERVKFHIRPMEERCSVKIQKEVNKIHK